LDLRAIYCGLLLLQRKSPRSRDPGECIGRKADRLPARATTPPRAPGRLFVSGRGIKPPGCLLEGDVVVCRARPGRGRREIGRVARDVALRREAVAVAAATVTTTAEELDGVGDDLHGLALARAVGRLPLAPVEAAVDRDAAALLQVLGAVLALRAPDRDVEVVGLVDPLAGRVLPTRVDRDAQLAD